MAVWVTQPDSLFATGAPGKGSIFKQLRDNLQAVTEGASGAPKIQAAAIDTGAVESIIATVAVGSVGSYALLKLNTLTTLSAGTTVAGSSTTFSNAAGSTGTTPSGTWRLMGITTNVSATTSTSLFLRIS